MSTRILIVDDSEANRTPLRVALEAEGYTVVEACDGIEALEALECFGIDAVISDILMPNLDGFQLCYEVRNNQRHRTLPFIIHSSTYTAAADQQLALDFGADRFFPKPTPIPLLRDAIEELVRRGGYLSPKINSPAENLDVMKRHGETLIRKLEEKNTELSCRTADLHASETRLRAIIETVPDCVQVITRDGAVLEKNRACLAMFETDSCAVLGSEAFNELVALDYREALKASFNAAWRGERTEVEFEFVGKNDAQHWLETRFAPLCNASDEITALLAITRDNTERKRLETQFIQAQKMEVLGHLAGGVTHDFNNMLGIIMGYSEILLNEISSGSPLYDEALTIFHTAERAAALTRQLLIFSRKQAVQPQVLDLSELITGMDRMLQRLIGENMNLVTRPEPELGKVKADPGQIEQVLMNLTVNARDAMPNGGTITIETSNVTISEDSTTKAPPGDYIMFSVADNGTGMTDKVKAKLFEAFFTTKPAGKGTGLGLATCDSIVKRWSGAITVESELGVGTVFQVYLPRIVTPANVISKPNEGGPLPRGSETILLVEDEPGLRELAASILQKQGYTVLKAGSGKEALSIVRDRRGAAFDLLLTDMVMPEGSGKMVAEWLRAVNPEIKVLFTSGYSNCGIVTNGEVESGIEFLPKPYTPSVLIRKVREVLDAVALSKMEYACK